MTRLVVIQFDSDADVAAVRRWCAGVLSHASARPRGTVILVAEALQAGINDQYDAVVDELLRSFTGHRRPWRFGRRRRKGARHVHG